MARAKDPRPLAGYGTLLGTYSLGASLAVAAMRNRRVQVKGLDLRSFILLALATQHLSRLIAKDSIVAPLRAPFTRFVEATGEGEVDEAVVGKGLHHAIGELLTCPYCLGQWVASALVFGTVALPSFTTALTNVCALARASDVLQLAYDRMKNDG